MGADENVAIMRRAYEAFNTADMETLTETFDESAVGTFRAELQHLLADDDDRVIGIQRSTAERNGEHLDVGNCIVFQL